MGYDAVDGYNLIVKVFDLSKGSGVKIKVKCDYCKTDFLKSYRDYLKSPNDVCCNNCKKYKFQKTNLRKYGVNCTLQEKFTRNKTRKTFIEKYGVEYPLQNKEIQKKCFITCINNYKEITVYNNIESIDSAICNDKRKVRSSKQQDFIQSIYKGYENVPIGKYHTDILFFDEKVCFEYNGGGHFLDVIHNKISIDDFNQKELEKYKYFSKSGYKTFVIENKSSTMLSEFELLKIKERAFNILTQKDIIVYIYNFKEKTENLLKINDF